MKNSTESIPTKVANPIDNLPDSEIFSRDPEKWDEVSIEEAKKRLRRTVEKLRSVRKRT